MSMASCTARAEDIVYLTPEGEGGGRLTIEGQILDYTGEKITIGRARAAPRSFAASRVIDLQTQWNDAHRAGRDALANHDYHAAAERLAEANRNENRVWVRRLILTDLMRCHESLGQSEQAGDLFLAIALSDPTTPAYADAPLAWFPNDRVNRAKAEAWLAAADQPAAVVLGASYLLSTTAAPTARQPLVDLLNHRDARIAALVEAQLWRTELMRATADDAGRWAARIEQMPDNLRAGPYFVLGQAYERLGMADEAALAYLRVPVLFGQRRELAARSLVAAGRLTSRSGFPAEAARVWNEVVTAYADTPQQAEAQQLLRASR